MNPKAALVVVVVVFVLAAGYALGETDMGIKRPKSVTASCFTSSADVSWEAISDPHLSGYDVYSKRASESSYVKANSALVTATQYAVTGLSSRVTYDFGVVAVYDNDQASGMSDPATCTTS